MNEPNTFFPVTGQHPVTPDAQDTLIHGHTSADASLSTAATAPNTAGRRAILTTEHPGPTFSQKLQQSTSRPPPFQGGFPRPGPQSGRGSGRGGRSVWRGDSATRGWQLAPLPPNMGTYPAQQKRGEPTSPIDGNRGNQTTRQPNLGHHAPFAPMAHLGRTRSRSPNNQHTPTELSLAHLDVNSVASDLSNGSIPGHSTGASVSYNAPSDFDIPAPSIHLMSLPEWIAAQFASTMNADVGIISKLLFENLGFSSIEDVWTAPQLTPRSILA